MERRYLWIILGVVALIGALFFMLLFGAVMTFFIVQARAQNTEHTTFPPERSEQVVPLPAGEDGLLVAGVDPDSPAAAAGLRRGDIVLEINGQSLAQEPLLLWRLVDELEPGEEIDLLVQHGDERRSLSLPLEMRAGQPYLGLRFCAPGMSGPGMPGPGMGEQPGQPGFDFGQSTYPIITEVLPGGPAEAAGLQAGDQIRSLDGVEIGPGESLGEMIAERAPGEVITLELVGAGSATRTVEVTLGENPETPGRAYLGIRYRAAPDLRPFEGGEPPQFNMPGAPEAPGSPHGPLPPGSESEPPFAHPFPLPEDVNGGALIGMVMPDSPADQAGLLPGDFITAVDGSPVQSSAELVEQIQARSPGDAITLEVFRVGENAPLQVEAVLGENPDAPGRAYLGVSLTPLQFDNQPGDGSPRS